MSTLFVVASTTTFDVYDLPGLTRSSKAVPPGLSSASTGRFYANDTRFAWANSDGVTVYDTSDWSIIPGVVTVGKEGRGLDINHSLNLAGLGTEDGYLKIYDISNPDSWSEIQELSIGYSLRMVSFSANDLWVATGSSVNGTRVYNVSDWSRITEVGGTWVPRGLHFTNDSRWLLKGNQGTNMDTWDSSNNWATQNINCPTWPHDNAMPSAGGDRVFVNGQYFGGVYTLDDPNPANWSYVSTIADHRGSSGDAHWSDDDAYLLVSNGGMQTGFTLSDGTTYVDISPGDIPNVNLRCARFNGYGAVAPPAAPKMTMPLGRPF